MFWGLIVKQGKKYTKMVEQDFQLTHAALDLSTSNGDVQVMLTTDNITYLLCTLSKSIPQVRLDQQFAAGDEISFATKGQGVVHLTGNVLPDDEFCDMDDEDTEEDDEAETVEENGVGKERSAKKAAKAKVAKEIASGKVPAEESDEDDATFSESMVEDSALNGDDDEDDSEDDGEDDEDDDDDDDDDEGMDQEDDDDEDDDDDDDDDEEDEDDDDDDEEEEDDDDDAESEQEDNKQGQQKNKAAIKSAKQEGNKETAKQVTANDSKGSLNGSANGKEAAPKKQEQQKTGSTRTLQDGLIIEELKVGTGPAAKPGKKVAVYYEGRLKSNNKVFDSTNKGPGLRFNLGRGEVIKGWDLGVAGMKVGGKRKLIIPHKLAYGQKGSPPVIPPCSTLVFEVELKKVF